MIETDEVWREEEGRRGGDGVRAGRGRPREAKGKREGEREGNEVKVRSWTLRGRVPRV